MSTEVKSKDFYIVTSGNINALNGASKFCKTLYSETSFWTSRGINIVLYSNSGLFSDAQRYTASKKHIIKQMIKVMLEKTNIGRNILFFQYNIEMYKLCVRIRHTKKERSYLSFDYKYFFNFSISSC